MQEILTPLPTLIDPSLRPGGTTSDANTEAGGKTKGREVGLAGEPTPAASPCSGY